MKNKTPTQIFLAFIVLFLLAVSFVVVLIAVPYLFYLLLVIFFKTVQFGVVFILLFWFLIVIFLWVLKIAQIISKGM
ncbi:hypothetical protein [Persephonella sp.]|nr:hypothetical protein [Persephonella sp.]